MTSAKRLLPLFDILVGHLREPSSNCMEPFSLDEASFLFLSFPFRCSDIVCKRDAMSVDCTGSVTSLKNKTNKQNKKRML